MCPIRWGDPSRVHGRQVPAPELDRVEAVAAQMAGHRSDGVEPVLRREVVAGDLVGSAEPPQQWLGDVQPGGGPGAEAEVVPLVDREPHEHAARTQHVGAGGRERLRGVHVLEHEDGEGEVERLGVRGGVLLERHAVPLVERVVGVDGCVGVDPDHDTGAPADGQQVAGQVAAGADVEDAPAARGLPGHPPGEAADRGARGRRDRDPAPDRRGRRVAERHGSEWHRLRRGATVRGALSRRSARPPRPVSRRRPGRARRAPRRTAG